MKEIKNTTIYTKETVKKFLEVYYFDKIKSLRIILNIFIAIIIITFILKDKRTTLDTITFIFSLFGLLEINTRLLPMLNYYKLTKTKNNIINTKVTYIFKKNNFKLNKDEYIDYNTLKKVIETDSYYYLYINNSRSLIVDKTSFNEEEKNHLTNLLKNQVPTYIYK